MEKRTGREVRMVDRLSSGFEGSSRPKNFRFNFLASVAALKENPDVWVPAQGHKPVRNGAYAFGVTRRRVRELARQHARMAAKR